MKEENPLKDILRVLEEIRKNTFKMTEQNKTIIRQQNILVEEMKGWRSDDQRDHQTEHDKLDDIAKSSKSAS